MAHHPRSPSGSSSSRRLSELLREQQDPFYLDLYLLEKGCSPAFLDAAACGGGACSTCCPRSRSISDRLLRRPARSKKGPSASGVLRLLLSKILTGATTAPAAAKKRQQPVAIDWPRVDDEKKRPPPGRLNNAAPSQPRAVDGQQHMEVDEEQEEDEEEEESSKKQLSPVSVLEQRLFEHSPPPHAQKALVLFSELLEAACTPTTLLHLLPNARQHRSSSNKSTDGRRGTDGGSTPTPRRARKNNSSHARRDAEDMPPFERDLARVTALVASEMASARVRPEDVRPSRQEEIGAAIAAAVLEALTEETAAELLADGDGPRLRG